MKVDLKSSVEKQGKRVTQIVTALTGIKKTFRGVKTETIEQGQFTHFETEDGRLVLINDKNVAWVEVFKEYVNAD
jgi:predicted ABC-class ATPase